MFSSAKRHFALLLLLFFYFSSGLFFFCRGFLLVRSEISSHSDCQDVQAEKFPSENLTNNCWIKPTFKKVVILLIDALRFDFVQWQDKPVYPYHNRLKSVHNFLQKPEHAALYKFVADAPTTTLQRIKGLTAGNLPTFIDAGKNFAGSEIVEDNFIQQIKSNGKNITFLGDDTWLSLYPTQFHRSYPFPSFDVQDLHTVDNGVLTNLYMELERKDWTLLIGHFLGVDHCGHRYGPNNANMALKLNQMDDVIANVSREIDEDTVLFVFGDHGMTSTGDHGGDSQDETNAALFAYSKRKIFRKRSTGASIWQTDLVPTLSLLLDLPIPFSSLGSVIPDFFSESLVQATSANLWQVVRFAEHYSSYNYGDSVLSKRLDPVLRTITAMEQEQISPNKCLEFVEEIRSIFRDRWALFNDGWIVLGILTLMQNWLWCVLMIIEEKSPPILLGKRNFLKFLSFILIVIVIIVQHESLPPVLGMLIAFQVVIDLHCIATHAISWNSSNFLASTGQMSTLLVLIVSLSLFSNSFVVEHARVVLFLAQTVIVLLTLSNLSDIELKVSASWSKKQRGEACKAWIRNAVKHVMLCMLLMFLLRCSFAFQKCREEQKACENSPFALSFASADVSVQQMRMASAALSLALAVCVPYAYFKRNGHFVAIRINTLVCMYLPALASVFILFHWMCLWLPERTLTQLPPAALLIPPRLAFVTLFLQLFVLVFDPLMIHFMRPPKRERNDKVKVPPASTGNTLTDFVKANSRLLFEPKEDETALTLYGFPSAVSSYLLAIVQICVMTLMLIVGDGLAPAVLIIAAAIVVAMELFSKNHPWSLVCLLYLISCLFFYGIGHQPTLSQLPIEAAFVGVSGTSDWRILQALLIIVHCFASHILVILGASLLLVWKDFPTKTGFINLHNYEDKVELSTQFEGDSFWLKMVMIFSVKMLTAVATAGYHQRHLMVWKIFAPNFIYESVAFIVSFLFLLIAFMLFENVRRKQLNMIRMVK